MRIANDIENALQNADSEVELISKYAKTKTPLEYAGTLNLLVFNICKPSAIIAYVYPIKPMIPV